MVGCQTGPGRPAWRSFDECMQPSDWARWSGLAGVRACHTCWIWPIPFSPGIDSGSPVGANREPARHHKLKPGNNLHRRHLCRTLVLVRRLGRRLSSVVAPGVLRRDSDCRRSPIRHVPSASLEIPQPSPRPDKLRGENCQSRWNDDCSRSRQHQHCDPDKNDRHPRHENDNSTDQLECRNAVCGRRLAATLPGLNLNVVF